MFVKRRNALAILLLAYVAFLLSITLVFFPHETSSINLVPFRTIASDWRTGGLPFLINFVGNIVAFMPVGILPPLIRTRKTEAWEMALFGLGLSVVIEGGQYLFSRRCADVDDLILNTLGAVLGYAMVLAIRARVPRTTPSRRAELS